MTAGRIARQQRLRPTRLDGMPVTKRLVVHAGSTWGRARRGPHDGDPVFLMAPCDRLRAGYRWECGEGFGRDLGEMADDMVPQARIELAPHGVGTRFLEDAPRWGHAQVSEDEQDRLQAQIEALAVGTVVERFGTGIAQRFEDARSSESEEEYPF